MATTKRTPEERFWSKVNKTDACWLWTGAVAKDGYAQFMAGYRRTYVHRWSWEFAYGPIPDDLIVCHRCDTPLCVRPSHLFLGTHADNSQDASRKGRVRAQKITHCPKGHAYTSENTFMRKCGSGVQRSCRTCRNNADRARYAQRKASTAGERLR